MSRTREQENNIGRAGGVREQCSRNHLGDLLPDELHIASVENSDQQQCSTNPQFLNLSIIVENYSMSRTTPAQNRWRDVTRMTLLSGTMFAFRPKMEQPPIKHHLIKKTVWSKLADQGIHVHPSDQFTRDTLPVEQFVPQTLPSWNGTNTWQKRKICPQKLLS